MSTWDGTLDTWCCGPDCYNEYHSVENTRERKLNDILKCTTTKEK